MATVVKSYPVDVVQPVVSDVFLFVDEVVSLRVEVALLHFLFQVEGSDGNSFVTVNRGRFLTFTHTHTHLSTNIRSPTGHYSICHV